MRWLGGHGSGGCGSGGRDCIVGKLRNDLGVSQPILLLKDNSLVSRGGRDYTANMSSLILRSGCDNWSSIRGRCGDRSAVSGLVKVVLTVDGLLTLLVVPVVVWVVSGDW